MSQKENAAQAWQGLRGEVNCGSAAREGPLGGKGTISREDENVTDDIIQRNAVVGKGIGQSGKAIG